MGSSTILGNENDKISDTKTFISSESSATMNSLFTMNKSIGQVSTSISYLETMVNSIDKKCDKNTNKIDTLEKKDGNFFRQNPNITIITICATIIITLAGGAWAIYNSMDNKFSTLNREVGEIHQFIVDYNIKK
ncbi:hypothetical protein [Pectinatus frisingensis]|uniref:hypothetical protein n=1 Tax=Pectinatus frisingensis TaxID=865 RepID=UPI0018C5B602|nr:hypothetical protein [Pectinatus frisingensis]